MQKNFDQKHITYKDHSQHTFFSIKLKGIEREKESNPFF